MFLPFAAAAACWDFLVGPTKLRRQRQGGHLPFGTRTLDRKHLAPHLANNCPRYRVCVPGAFHLEGAMWKLITITLATTVGLQQLTGWVWDPLADKPLLDMPVASVATMDTGDVPGSWDPDLDRFNRNPPAMRADTAQDT
jgi:hypothetical protein